MCVHYYDIQLIPNQYAQTMNKIGLDDYIMAAINIYLDIINLFLYILYNAKMNKDEKLK